MTILRKRHDFRRAFDGFDHRIIAAYGDDDVERLMADASIVRHRGKIEAVINNARCLSRMQDSGIDLGELIWSYALEAPFGRSGDPDDGSPIASKSPESMALSSRLRMEGWKFVGPTTVYSMMQSMGLVNDHVEGCFVRADCEEARRITLGRRRPAGK